MTKPNRKGELNHQGHQVRQEQRKVKLWKRNDGSIFILTFVVKWGYE